MLLPLLMLAVVLLTPVVVATARTLSMPAAPHAYATAHLANSGSLLLSVPDLTNLLAFAGPGCRSRISPRSWRCRGGPRCSRC